MKVLRVLLLTAMVAIAMEKCVAEYLLVEIEDGPKPMPKPMPEPEPNPMSKEEVTKRRESMFNARTTNKCSWSTWGKWGQCSESCGNGFRERVRTKTAGQSGKESCTGLPKETKRCQIRNNNCESLPVTTTPKPVTEKPRYSLISDYGCGHVSGKSGWAFVCQFYQVPSKSSCEDQCTASDSCVGYEYAIFANLDCRLFPSERSCPAGFTPIKPWESWPIAASMNDLSPLPNTFPNYVCYGKA